jgi:hypothetical protein
LIQHRDNVRRLPTRDLDRLRQEGTRTLHAARAARQFPAIFAALADGRLHLSAVVMLAPYLTEENVDELLAAAAHKSKSELDQLFAQRFPHADVPPGWRLSGRGHRSLTNWPRGQFRLPLLNCPRGQFCLPPRN